MTVYWYLIVAESYHDSMKFLYDLQFNLPLSLRSSMQYYNFQAKGR